jgi:signal transduction histidine kinase
VRLAGDGEDFAAAAARLRDVERALLPPSDAILDQLRLLAELGGLREVSLWTLDEADRVHLLAHARGEPARGVRGIARQALRGGETAPGPRRALVAFPVGPAEAPVAALAARVPPGHSANALALFAEAAPLLACVIERERLLEAGERRAAVIAAGERRLTRFGLDLHDGPLQGIAALLSDLRLFSGQLESELAGHPRAELLSGRAQDLEGRALELETELREHSRSAGAGAAIDGSVSEALRSEVRAFAHATGVVPALQVAGPVEDSTTSQRVTLLRGIQEAMRNAREHSGAGSVSVSVEASENRLEATVEDDGRGFDVKRALARARRGGRLGLAGIEQRARLLGGSCTVRSRPGGPTAVTISLPRWKQGSPAI